MASLPGDRAEFEKNEVVRLFAQPHHLVQLTLRGLVQLDCRASRREVVRRDDRERPILSARASSAECAEPSLSTSTSACRGWRPARPCADTKGATPCRRRGPHWRRAEANRRPGRTIASSSSGCGGSRLRNLSASNFSTSHPSRSSSLMRDLPVRAGRTRPGDLRQASVNRKRLDQLLRDPLRRSFVHVLYSHSTQFSRLHISRILHFSDLRASLATA